MHADTSDNIVQPFPWPPDIVLSSDIATPASFHMSTIMLRRLQTNTNSHNPSQQPKRVHSRHNAAKVDKGYDTFPTSLETKRPQPGEHPSGRDDPGRINKFRYRPSSSDSSSKSSLSGRQAGAVKPRRVSAIDRLAPRRIRSEKYRRKFMKYKQVSSL